MEIIGITILLYIGWLIAPFVIMFCITIIAAVVGGIAHIFGGGRR